MANTEGRKRGSKLEVYREDGQHLIIVSTIPLQERFLEIKKNMYLEQCVRKTPCGLRLSIHDNQHQDLLRNDWILKKGRKKLSR